MHGVIVRARRRRVRAGRVELPVGMARHRWHGRAEQPLLGEAAQVAPRDPLGQLDELVGADARTHAKIEDFMAAALPGDGASVSSRPLATPSAQFSLTLRVALPSRPGGVLGKVTAAITRAGGSIVAVDTVEARGDRTLREITVECSGVEHRGHVITAVQSVRTAKVVEITDRTFEVHRSGKIHTGLNIPVKTRDDLSMAYTPGVARVCSAIAENRQKAFKYTIKANTVAG